MPFSESHFRRDFRSLLSVNLQLCHILKFREFSCNNTQKPNDLINAQKLQNAVRLYILPRLTVIGNSGFLVCANY